MSGPNQRLGSQVLIALVAVIVAFAIIFVVRAAIHPPRNIVGDGQTETNARFGQ
jgi:ABC-type transporter Mla subunit MlaD